MPRNRISIIIPAFNEEKYLPGCLQALADLDYNKELIEIIVVDNGSTDRSRQIALEYGVTVYEDASKTVAGLRNLGASKATGDILAFVDADCIVSTDWLTRAAIYFDDSTVASWGGPPLPPEDSSWVERTWFLLRRNEKGADEVNWLGTIDLFVRKQQFLSINGFDESLTTCEDSDLSYKMSQFGRLLLDPEIKVVHMRDSRTVLGFLKKEVWRGQSSLNGIKSHGFLLRELPSLAIPFYFWLLILTLLVVIIFPMASRFMQVLPALYILPTLVVICKVVRRNRAVTFAELLRLSLLIQVYFFSRTIAVFKRA